jgi:hypothetical protein
VSAGFLEGENEDFSCYLYNDGSFGRGRILWPASSHRKRNNDTADRNAGGAGKGWQLPPDADVTSIIKGLNDVSVKISAVDTAFQESAGKTEESFNQMKTATDEAFRENSDAIAALRADVQSEVQKLMLDKAITDIRAHILKVKVELAAQNVGSAKTEMDRIIETLKHAGEFTGKEKESALNELMDAAKKIKAEVDQDLPVAVNRIDLLWHELGKLRGKD